MRRRHRLRLQPLDSLQHRRHRPRSGIDRHGHRRRTRREARAVAPRLLLLRRLLTAMYTLLGIDTVLRITIALVFLSIVVPALAWRHPRSLEEWWFSLAAVVVALTLAGQLFTLLHIAGTFTYLALIAAFVIIAHARKKGVSPLEFIAMLYSR